MSKFANVTTRLYIFSFFDDFILIYPLYTLMFADAGLKPAKVASLLIAWSLTAFLLEIPAGVIADRYPRRRVLLAGIAARAAGYLFWILMPNYFGFLIGFILWGIKSALTTGTLEALAYDELVRLEKLPLYARLTGRMGAIGIFGTVAASFGASLLAHHEYSFILWLSIAAILVSGAAIYSLPKAKIVKGMAKAGYMSYLKDGLQAVARKPIVLYLVLFMSVVAGLGAVDEYFNLFLREKGLTNMMIAFWLGVINLFAAAGSLLAHKLEDKKFAANAALFGWATLLLLISFSPKMLAAILLGLYAMFFAAVGVLFNTHLQKHISDQTRATTTSVSGFGSELFAMLSFAIVGFGANRSGYVFSFRLVAVSVVMVAAFLTFYSHRHKLVL